MIKLNVHLSEIKLLNELMKIYQKIYQKIAISKITDKNDIYYFFIRK